MWALVFYYLVVSFVVALFWRDYVADFADPSRRNETLAIDPRFSGETGARALAGILLRAVYWPLVVVWWFITEWVRVIAAFGGWLTSRA